MESSGLLSVGAEITSLVRIDHNWNKQTTDAETYAYGDLKELVFLNSGMWKPVLGILKELSLWKPALFAEMNVSLPWPSFA